MKHVVFLFMLLIFIFQLFADGVQPEGIGSEDDPYQIETLDNLLWLSTTQSAWQIYKHFIQISDIDASDTENWNNGKGFSPIGFWDIEAGYDIPFRGTYNGNDHNISGLFIDRPSESYLGLFGCTNEAAILSLGVTDVTIIGSSLVGGLVGNCDDSMINNCYSTGYITGENCVGVLTGLGDDSTISESYAAGELSGIEEVGGLAGALVSVACFDCYAQVSVSGQISVGGFAGYSNAYECYNCYSSGNVDGEEMIGGFAGSSYSNTNACYSVGSVTGSSKVGGFAGKLLYATCQNCYATGSVNGLEITGGFFGECDNHQISNCYSSGYVYAENAVGGFGGYVLDSEIENVVWDLDLSEQDEGIGSESSSTITGLLGNTIEEMQTILSFTELGWDFVGEIANGSEDTWDIDADVNNGYPYIYELMETIWGNGLYARFSSDLTYGSVPLMVSFSDESYSSATIVDWQWDFDNDGIMDSYEQNPGWTYNEYGVYSVSLVVTDDQGRESATELRINYITVYCETTQPQGNGTEANPYLVQSLGNLKWISENESCWNSFFQQTADIDASNTQIWNNGAGFSPIGFNTYHPFTGSYNGDNYYISDLSIQRSETNNIGLFGYTESALIEELGIVSCDVEGKDNTGGLAGNSTSNSLISNCYVSGTINGHENVGCLAGVNNSSTITQSHTLGEVRGEIIVGNLVGLNENNGFISECFATGSVYGELATGGLAGAQNESLISECYASGDVNGLSNTGGLCGENYGYQSTISNCYATGAVSGEERKGGLVGYNCYSSILKSYSCGNVSGYVVGNDDTGGFVGYTYHGNIYNCIWNLDASGQTDGYGSSFDSMITNLLGKTTTQMQLIDTYLDLGWDFTGETTNGVEDYWDIDPEVNNGFAYIVDLLGLSGFVVIADFSAFPACGHIPLTVNFRDESLAQSTVIDWQWDFDNDGIIDSYEQNPAWIYNQPGEYTISLTVSDEESGETDIKIKSNYIEIFPIAFGDVDDNNIIGAYDVSVILRFILGYDPLPEDPLPWEEWRMLRADVNLDNEVSALDASYVLQYIVEIITEFPVTDRTQKSKDLHITPE